MKTFINIVIFLLVVVGGYTWFSNSIPQLKAEPPSEEEVSLKGLTPETYAAMGQKIFKGKGTCKLCHNPVGGRAPMLDTVGAIAEDRLMDGRYKGKAAGGEDYIRESLVDPSAFVVAGFGKKGTNDTVSPMPDVSKGAIGLSDVEINAVIAYLQSSSGVEITVPIPTGDIEVSGEEAAQIKVAANATEALVKFECGTCHMHALIEEGGDVGPEIGKISNLEKHAKKAGLTLERYLAKSITDPNSFIVADFDEDMMPADYPERMTVAELKMIVDALLGKEAETMEAKE